MLTDADEERALPLQRLRDVLAADWGFSTTASDMADVLAERCRDLLAAVEAAPKGRTFRLRARIGRRKSWYDVPEESL